MIISLNITLPPELFFSSIKKAVFQTMPYIINIVFFPLSTLLTSSQSPALVTTYLMTGLPFLIPYRHIAGHTYLA